MDVETVGNYHLRFAAKRSKVRGGRDCGIEGGSFKVEILNVVVQKRNVNAGARGRDLQRTFLEQIIGGGVPRPRRAATAKRAEEQEWSKREHCRLQREAAQGWGAENTGRSLLAASVFLRNSQQDHQMRTIEKEVWALMESCRTMA